MLDEITNSSLYAAIELTNDKVLKTTKNKLQFSNFQNSIDLEGGKLLLKILGNQVFEDYQNNKNKKQILRLMIAEFLKKQNYFLNIIDGREVFVEDNISYNFKVIFEQADLLKDTSDFSDESKLVIQWWDDLTNYARNLINTNDALLIKGRIAEEKSIKYEINKLKKLKIRLKPKYVGQDNIRLGYDVVSYNKNKDKIFIEVKSSSHNNGRFYFTRNQWLTAKKEGENYFIHLWIKNSNEPKILNINYIEKFVPKDSMNSEWQETFINPLK